MLESEMEDLLWMYPDSFLREPLKPFRRQPRSDVGRADLVFEDRLGRLLVIEIKRGQLKRGAIDQIHDYYGMLKREFPDRPVEMMVIAQSIPEDRKLALGQYHIEYREISEQRFRDVAAEVKFVFHSEQQTVVQPTGRGSEAVPDSDDAPASTKPSSPREARPELIAVVNVYNATAEPGLVGKDDKAKNYRQIVPPEWKRTHLHYEFYQANQLIGAELHIARHLPLTKVPAITEFLKTFHGREVANGEAKLTWDGTFGSGKGRLTARFPLISPPGIAAAAMRDLISMTRAGVSARL